MTKNLALAASLVMVMTISGQALAEAATPSEQQAVYAFNAFDRAAATTRTRPARSIITATEIYTIDV